MKDKYITDLASVNRCKENLNAAEKCTLVLFRDLKKTYEITLSKKQFEFIKRYLGHEIEEERDYLMTKITE